MFAAPCFAAIGAMKRELGNVKDPLFTAGFQTGLAYVLALIVNQVGNLIFRGTKLTEKVMLDYSAAEEASEAIDIIIVALVLIFAFLGIKRVKIQ